MLKKHFRGNNSKSLKWSGVLIAILMALSVTVGIVGVKTSRAIEGDLANWTAEGGDGLTLTVVSVQQNEVELVPVWDDYLFNDDTYDFGNYYFNVANTGDAIRLGVRVDGMKDGKSYEIFDETELTSADNGRVLYEDVKPHTYTWNMSDGIECYHDQDEPWCSYTYLTNEYVIDATLRESNWNNSVGKNIIVRPDKVGSSDIEIVSVQQNGEDVVLDKVGRHVNTIDEMQTVPQTLNEYTINDYNTPIEVTVKFKNLEVGKHYPYGIGEGNYGAFTASSTEETITSELRLNYLKKHVNASIYLYSSDYMDNKSVTMYFRVADANFHPLGDIIIDAISQGGEQITPTYNNDNGSREYTFRANDVQPIDIALHATEAAAGMNYYFSYTMNGDAWVSSDEPIAISGDELGRGAVLTIPAGYGLGEGSALYLTFSINTTGTSYGYGPQLFIYQDYGEERRSDGFFIDYYEDDELPRYDASIGYTINGEEISDVINAKYHDEDNPLWVKVMGERYDDTTTYNVRAKVATGNNDIYDTTFTATGAELNEGKTFVLNGLALSLPEFDPSGSTSGYEKYYDFSLEINGLERKGTLYYMHNGYLYTVMTYAGGSVSASEGGNGMGGAMYMTSSYRVVRKSSLDGSRNAVLHYRGGGFDDDLSYGYALYYNSNAGDSWWSAPAGTKIEEGVMPGSSLNRDGLTVNVAVPDDASESSMYSLVITRNGGLVIVSKDFLQFTDAPQLEAFKFNADSDSFMQTGSASYRLARGTDATATLIGAGFEENQQYKVWVSYEGNYEENDGEGGGRWEDIDLSGLDDMVVVTGAELNAGYEYALDYSEAIDDATQVAIMFEITDIDNDRPSHYAGNEEGLYSGHSIYIEYVSESDVFNSENGFQIDEDTSEIIDVSQPTGTEVRNLTGDVAETVVIENSLNVTSSKACMVIGQKNGEYERINAVSGAATETTKTYAYDLTGYLDVMVVLKGDGDMDGEVSSADSNLINRSLISSSLRPYRELSELERIIFDLDGDNEITSSDSNLINRSLISSSLRPYKAIEW